MKILQGILLVGVLIIGFPLASQVSIDNKNLATEVNTITPVLEFRGIDASSLLLVEANNAEFYINNEPVELLKIMRDQGFNFLRIRLFNDPIDGIYNLDYAIDLATRASDLGYNILLDFHFSDTWADPGAQLKPQNWKEGSFHDLQASITNYTYSAISTFLDNNIKLKIVQIGNEITCGILWPDANVCENNQPETWNNLIKLIISAIDGVNEAYSDHNLSNDLVHYLIHTDRPSTWFFDNLFQYSANYSEFDFNYIGLSFYPMWHGTLENFISSIIVFSEKYDKDIILVETNYPFTLGWNDDVNNIVGLAEQLDPNYPATPQGQFDFFHKLISTLTNLGNDRGKGIFYWEPGWISSEVGSAVENIAMFDFDGNLLPIGNIFSDLVDTQSDEVKYSSISTNGHSEGDTLSSNNNEGQFPFKGYLLIITLLYINKRRYAI